jgi:4-hydroxythreonine-4-phosphate dehydrogenase
MSLASSHRPLLAITMGDPAGIGPESISAAWNLSRFHQLSRAVVVGHPQVMRESLQVLGLADSIRVMELPRNIDRFDDLDFDPQQMHVWPVANDDVLKMKRCINSAAGGQAAYDCLVAATEQTRQQKFDAIVTAPLSKAALHMANKFYPGHTELLAELCGIDKVAMLLYLAPDGQFVLGQRGLGVAHVTLHMAMRDVFAQINEANIVATARLLHDFFLKIDRARIAPQVSAQEKKNDSPPLPRLAVAALNCHAGESGLFGDEEQTIIGPAVEICRQQGMQATGPIPCDTLMKRAAAGEFDGVVAMYHDQGHIALKLIGMHSAVNVTLGLPIIRTSVAHGTAFDIAWQGKVNPNSMLEATRIAAALCEDVLDT